MLDGHDREVAMTKFAVTATLLVLSGALLGAAEGGTMFQFNDQRFELKHAYAFQMETPDFDAMSAAGPGEADKLKFKKTLAIALSDQSFDTEALAKLDQPFDAFDKMREAGAVLVVVAGGKDGKVESLRVVMPRRKMLDLDTSVGALTLNPPKKDKVSGRLVIKGDHKMHDFDPENIPLVEADVSFVTAAPAP